MKIGEAREKIEISSDTLSWTSYGLISSNACAALGLQTGCQSLHGDRSMCD